MTLQNWYVRCSLASLIARETRLAEPYLNGFSGREITVESTTPMPQGKWRGYLLRHLCLLRSLPSRCGKRSGGYMVYSKKA